MKLLDQMPADSLKSATKVGVSAGIAFYEHPSLGDEAPLVAVISDRVVLTDEWELPDAENASLIAFSAYSLMREAGDEVTA